MSEAIRNAIAQVDDWKNKDAATLLAAITATNYTPKQPTARVWSIAGIAKEFGVAVAETIYGALNASGLSGIAARFAATGLDTTDPQWLANADAIIASGSLDPVADAETQTALKYIGHTATKLYSGTPTEQQVADAKQSLLNMEDASAVKAEIENTWLNPAIANGAQTAAELRAAIKAGL